jgi:hypothetical protein
LAENLDLTSMRYRKHLQATLTYSYSRWKECSVILSPRCYRKAR